MALDKVLKIYDENGNPVDYDILASDVKFLPGGKTLGEKLTEMEDAIENAGSGDGTVTGVKVGSTPYKPDSNGVVDLSVPFADKATKSELQSAIDTLTNTLNTLIGSGNVQGAIDTFNEVKAFLNGIDTDDPTLANQLLALNNAISDLQTSLAAKANSADVYSKSEVDGKVADAGKVKTVSINGQTKTPDARGNVDLGTIEKGEKGDKGDTGNVQVDGNGNVLIYNGRDMTTTGAALDASQGQFLGKMLNAKDNTFYNVWVGTQAELEALEEYEDNTIFIVGTIPTVVQRFNVSFDGGEHTSVPSSTPHTVKEGSAFSVVVSPASGYTIDSATGAMEGGTLTKTNNQDGTVTFSTTSVTGAITIQAAATKHITGITVSAGTRSGNSIPLTAVVAPSGADNVTLAWSVDDTTNFSISGNGTSATLTIKSGASNASIVITCADTNAASGTKSGTLQLTGLSYEETPIPITEITDITATRTAANTLRLDAVTNPADANTPTVTYSLVGTVPTVKQVRRWAAGDEVDGEVKESAGNDLIELPAVELSGNTLSYKGDCQVTVRATAGNVTHDETIDIVHDDADAIWFEDSAVKSVLTSSGIGSGGNVTYAQAEATTTFKRNDVHIFQNNKTIIRFNECKYFKIGTVATGASSPCRLDGCTALKALSFRSGTYFNANALTSLTALEELTINSGFTTEFISSANTKLKYIKVGNAATSVSNTFQGLKVETVDLGTGIATLPNQCFKSVTTLKSLTLRYNGKVGFGGDQVFANLTAGSVDLYVPADQVSNYANYHAAIKAVHAIED